MDPGRTCCKGINKIQVAEDRVHCQAFFKSREFFTSLITCQGKQWSLVAGWLVYCMRYISEKMAIKCQIIKFMMPSD
jgi:hypothetical protein